MSIVGWIITFFLLAVLAALLGFGGLAGTFASVAQFLTALFVVLFVGIIVYSVVTGRRPPSSVL